MTRPSESWRPSLLAREMLPLRFDRMRPPLVAQPPAGVFTVGYVASAISEKLARDRERDRLAAERRRLLNSAAFDFGEVKLPSREIPSTSHAMPSSTALPSSTSGRRKRARTRRGGAKKRRTHTTNGDSTDTRETPAKRAPRTDDTTSPLWRHSTPVMKAKKNSTSTDSGDTALGASRASLSFVHDRHATIDDFTESELLD
jgi:hypothetical protein